MSQSFDVVENKNKYHLIIMVKTDYLFTDKSVTERTLKFYCKYVTERNPLLVERMSFVPQRTEVWLYHGYMLGNSIVYKDIFFEISCHKCTVLVHWLPFLLQVVKRK